jgi:alpha-1,2-mannosyltransferase
MPAAPSDPIPHARLAPGFTALVGALLVVLATAVFAVRSGFLPPRGFVGDFTQDWLSARDYLDGRPVYGHLPDALRRHFGREPPQNFLRWNAHPPVSVLFILPVAGLDHDRALVAWNWLTFPLFVLAVWLVAAELGVRPAPRAAALAAVVSILGTTCHPLYQQVINGQFNALLAFLIAVAWVADRRDRWWLAGAAVGTAAAVKLFPGFLVLYFLAARRWRAALAAVVCFLLVNGLAVVLFGVGAYRTYICEVIPAVSAEYATTWNNLSVPAFWLRLFDPVPASRVLPLAHAPVLGRVLAVAAQLIVVGLVAWAGWRARSGGDRDRAFALAVVGMLLVSPITWPHYLVLLVAPIALFIARFPRGTARLLLLVCLGVLWLPDTVVPWLVFGPDEAFRMTVHRHEPLSPVGNLLMGSVPHYALLGVFVLAFRLSRSGSEPPTGSG